MAKDLLGNKLEAGDLVRMNLDGGSQVIGRIQLIEDSRIVRADGGGKQVEPGRVVIAFIDSALFDPRNPIVPSLLKLAPNDEVLKELRPDGAKGGLKLKQ